jgi:hypothetical protein
LKEDEMMGLAMIATVETALAGLQMGRLALLEMQTKLDGRNAMQANGRLILIEALALLSYATIEAHGKTFEPHRKLRTIGSIFRTCRSRK